MSSHRRKDRSKPKDHISNSWSRIKRLSYGDEGFLRFLEILWGLLDVKEASQLNYYFALKVLLERMDNYEPCDKNGEERKADSFWNLGGGPSQRRVSQEL
jgi:hypothetical protein